MKFSMDRLFKRDTTPACHFALSRHWTASKSTLYQCFRDSPHLNKRRRLRRTFFGLNPFSFYPLVLGLFECVASIDKKPAVNYSAPGIQALTMH